MADWNHISEDLDANVANGNRVKQKHGKTHGEAWLISCIFCNYFPYANQCEWFVREQISYHTYDLTEERNKIST